MARSRRRWYLASSCRVPCDLRQQSLAGHPLSAKHHASHIRDCSQVLEGVALDKNEVGFLARSYSSGTNQVAEEVRRAPRCHSQDLVDGYARVYERLDFAVQGNARHQKRLWRIRAQCRGMPASCSSRTKAICLSTPSRSLDLASLPRSPDSQP